MASSSSNSASSTYELKANARCLVAHADDARHSFLVATSNLRGPNELRLLHYSEEEEDIRCSAVWHHMHEVLALAACPTDGRLAATVFDTLDGKGGRAVVWRLSGLPDNSTAAGDDVDGDNGASVPIANDVEKLGEVITSAPDSMGSVHAVAWAPTAEDTSYRGSLLTAHANSVRSWTLREGGGLLQSACSSFDAEASFVGAVAYDPHHTGEVAVAHDDCVSMWDLRSGDRTHKIEHTVSIGGGVVRGLSYNANKPWHLATAGDDFRVKLWDCRHTNAPIKVLDGHSHWTTAVAFNPYHDQLILSGGADGRVDLWRVSSISSAPLLELGDEGGEEDASSSANDGEGAANATTASLSAPFVRRTEPRMARDQAVHVHEDHDDAITGLAWSAFGAWIYASLSTSGRVAITAVPSAEKYRVLL